MGFCICSLAMDTTKYRHQETVEISRSPEELYDLIADVSEGLVEPGLHGRIIRRGWRMVHWHQRHG